MLKSIAQLSPDLQAFIQSLKHPLNQAGVCYGHTGNVMELLWSPDSSKLASRSEDGSILIWPVGP